MKKKYIIIILVFVFLFCAGIIFYPMMQVHEAERPGALNWELLSGQVNGKNSIDISFGSSLIETDAGYKLTVSINGDVVLYEKPDALKDLQKYSCILLALIDDLEEVTWNYSFNRKTETLRFEMSDAAALLGPENGGRQIKEYGRTAAGLQRLIDQTGFYSGVFIG